MEDQRQMAGRGESDMTKDRTFERIEALFEIEQFADVKVLVAGCGSGGSAVALQLVMSGIPNFTLIDHDVLGPENVIRHACGRRYLGVKKVEALADVLKDRNPAASISCIDVDLTRYPELRSQIAEADVVVLATDNDPTRYMINELCVSSGVPFVVGKVFTRGIGGEVFAYRPGTGGCLSCLEAVLQRTQFREGIREIDLVSEEEREKMYGMEVAEIKDSPGLGVDISFVTSFHTRFVLDAIARGLTTRPKYLIPINENYIIWGNRPVHPFKKHFELQRISLSPQEGCAVCSSPEASHV
jgi:molybdopterin/thiamine biosynthesis adenylyltransferase